MTNAELCRRLRDRAEKRRNDNNYSVGPDILSQAADAIDSLTARAEKAEAALREIAAPRSCGCSPACQCNSESALLITVEEYQDTARAAIAYIRARIDTGDFRSDYQRGELDACEKIEKAMNGGGE